MVEVLRACVGKFHAEGNLPFVEEGIKQPGDTHTDVLLRPDVSFQVVCAKHEAGGSITAQEKYVVMATSKAARQRKLRGERRARQQCS